MLRNSILLFCVISFVGCIQSTAVEPLPSATQQGMNTFGCDLNGVSWIPGSGFFLPPATESHVFQGKTTYLVMYANRWNKNPHTDISIVIDLFSGVGRYPIVFWDQNPCTAEPASYVHYNNDTLQDSLSGGGEVRVTYFDSVRHIVSGTFNFKGITEMNDAFDFSDGRFDLKYADN